MHIKVKPLGAKLAHTAGAYPSFRSMKPTGSIATPHGWDAIQRQITPSILSGCVTVLQYPFILLGGERHCAESLKVSCPRTHHNDPGQGSNPDRSIRSPTRSPRRPPKQRHSFINFQFMTKTLCLFSVCYSIAAVS